MSKVYVSARFTAQEGKAEELLAAFSRIIPFVRAEEGNIRYNLHRNTANPASFFLYETWENREALDKHMQTPHMKDYFSKAASLTQGPGEMDIWKEEDVL